MILSIAQDWSSYPSDSVQAMWYHDRDDGRSNPLHRYYHANEGTAASSSSKETKTKTRAPFALVTGCSEWKEAILPCGAGDRV